MKYWVWTTDKIDLWAYCMVYKRFRHIQFMQMAQLKFTESYERNQLKSGFQYCHIKPSLLLLPIACVFVYILGKALKNFVPNIWLIQTYTELSTHTHSRASFGIHA